jgi:hypothetical protein
MKESKEIILKTLPHEKVLQDWRKVMEKQKQICFNDVYFLTGSILTMLGEMFPS